MRDKQIKEIAGRLKQSLIESILLDVSCGRASIDMQDQNSKTNPNYPSSLEFAKSVLYRAKGSLLVEMPETPFRIANEIYDYISASLEKSAQTSPKCTPPNPEEVYRDFRDEHCSIQPK